MKYQIKCDECKKEIGRTDDVRESYQGGVCASCKIGTVKVRPICTKVECYCGKHNSTKAVA